ncbi:MAG TPA: hypothetical protein PKI99_02550, partial [Terrimesophilobacter sp.]|nr:hypothetical protein [Terrimesophilobacter sp.]
MPTHEVTNQAPPRAGIDEFAANRPLVDGVAHFGAEWALGDLRETGKFVGTSEFQRDAETANTRQPVLRTHDKYGNRIDEVEYDESYHRIIAAAVARGAHTSAWADPRPG